MRSESRNLGWTPERVTTLYVDKRAPSHRSAVIPQERAPHGIECRARLAGSRFAPYRLKGASDRARGVPVGAETVRHQAEVGSACSPGGVFEDEVTGVVTNRPRRHSPSLSIRPWPPVSKREAAWRRPATSIRRASPCTETKVAVPKLGYLVRQASPVVPIRPDGVDGRWPVVSRPRGAGGSRRRARERVRHQQRSGQRRDCSPSEGAAGGRISWRVEEAAKKIPERAFAVRATVYDLVVDLVT